MVLHGGLSLNLIAMAAGYLAFIAATGEEGIRQTVGRLIGIAVIAVSIGLILLELMIAAALCPMKCSKKPCIYEQAKCGKMVNYRK
jgi:lipopolysaccharide/colanic/teichoic acid biosynthesis glycosyltransferase